MAMSLFAKISKEKNSAWGYMLEGSMTDIFSCEKEYKIEIEDNLFIVPTEYCFEWLPSVLTKHLLRSPESLIVLRDNEQLVITSHTDLRCIQKNQK
jgi:hypothetical protein